MDWKVFLVCYVDDCEKKMLKLKKGRRFLNFASNSRVQYLLAFVLACTVGVFLIGPNLKARLGPIDDHEIVKWLGSDRKLQLREMPGMFFETEIGKFGNHARYRPSYYGIRLIETYLWRDYAIGWYAFRLFTFVLFSTVLIVLLMKYVGLPISMLTYLYVVNGKYWSDILARLGPAEIYAVPGLALYAVGCYLLWNEIDRYSRLGWILLFGGFIISVGAKENFLFLVLPTLILVTKLIKQQRLGKLGIIATLIMFGYATLITSSIMINAIKTGSNVYGTSIFGKDWVTKLLGDGKPLIRSIVNAWELKLLIVIIGYVLFAGKSKTRTRKKILRVTLVYFGVMLLLLTAFVSQYVYYGSISPAGMRYDFPKMMIPVLIWVVIAKYLVEVLEKLKMKRLRLLPYVVLGVFLIQRINISHYHNIRAQAERNAKATRKFMTQLEANVGVLKNHPDIPLVIESGNPFDYELIVSLRRYLDYFDVGNDALLRYESNPKYTNSSLGALLDKRLVDASKNGSTKYLKGFLSYDVLTLSGGCYSMVIGEAKSKECELLGQY